MENFRLTPLPTELEEIATLTQELQTVYLRLEECIEGVDALKARLEATEKERDEAVEFCCKLLYHVEADTSHFTPLEQVNFYANKIVEVKELKVFLKAQQRPPVSQTGEGKGDA